MNPMSIHVQTMRGLKFLATSLYGSHPNQKKAKICHKWCGVSKEVQFRHLSRVLDFLIFPTLEMPAQIALKPSEGFQRSYGIPNFDGLVGSS